MIIAEISAGAPGKKMFGGNWVYVYAIYFTWQFHAFLINIVVSHLSGVGMSQEGYP